MNIFGRLCQDYPGAYAVFVMGAKMGANNKA